MSHSPLAAVLEEAPVGRRAACVAVYCLCRLNTMNVLNIRNCGV